MKKFLIKNFDYFWNQFDTGWWKHYRTFVLTLTLFYIVEVLFLENHKLFYLACLIFHTTVNFIIFPLWFMRGEPELNYEIKKSISGLSYSKRKPEQNND